MRKGSDGGENRGEKFMKIVATNLVPVRSTGRPMARAKMNLTKNNTSEHNQ